MEANGFSWKHQSHMDNWASMLDYRIERLFLAKASKHHLHFFLGITFIIQSKKIQDKDTFTYNPLRLLLNLNLKYDTTP